MVSPGYPVIWIIVLAAAAFGIGVRINGACALAELAHLTGGNLNYAVTIIGMVLSAVALPVFGFAKVKGAMPQASALEGPTVGGAIFLTVLALVLTSALYRQVPQWWRALRDPSGKRMGPYRAMLVVGICGGLLYTLAGSWTYMNVLSQRAARLVDPSLAPSGWPALLCAVVLVAAGMTEAFRTQNTDLRAPKLWTALRCLLGGTIMGASAALIPGGNGTLLIRGLPFLAPHAMAAYTAMTLVLCMSFVMRKSKVA